MRASREQPPMAPEVRGYLGRRRELLQQVIDTVRVFSRRYNAACDELEEVEELLGIESH